MNHVYMNADVYASERATSAVSFRGAPASAFTRVFDALWRASKGDGPGASAVHPSKRACGAHLRMTVIVW